MGSRALTDGVALCLVALMAVAPSATGRTASDEWWSAGERFYQTGVALDAAPVRAVVQGDLEIRSTDMPCANCHRRSGWAGAEGTLAVPPVTGGILFAPVTQGSVEMGSVRSTGPGTRPAYDEVTLLRAIREGVDASGRRLSPAMPRYALGEQDGAALVAHLRTLGVAPPEGVTGTEVHLATITSPGVPAADRDAVLEVLRAYVREKNAGTRREPRRRERGPWDMKQHYQNYRTWTLHEWQLTGHPSTWGAQLESHYRRQPVFALVSGITHDDWTPIHAFAERERLPVVLPQAPLGAELADGPGFYTLYHSRGVALEAETLVDRLSTAPPPMVVQLSRCGSPGHVASQRVQQRLSLATTVKSACLPPHAPLTLDTTAGRLPAGTVAVLWLGGDDLAAARNALSSNVSEVYLSSTLTGAGERALPDLGRDTLVLSPFVPPADFAAHAWRALAWLQARGLSALPQRVAVNTLAAALVTADALGHPRALDSREYFVELIESMASRSPTRSAHPEMLFGTQRRAASAGCYVLRAPTSTDSEYRKVGTWAVPRS